MKNILIVTYDMIPYAEKLGSCQRMYFLAEYLQKKNFNVIVISSRQEFVNEQDFGYKIHFKHIAVTTYKYLRFLEKAYHYFSKRIVKHFGFEFLTELNTLNGSAGKTWLFSAKKSIKKNLISYNIDTVIISGPPFTLFKAVNFLKKYNCQIIVDYRDPWFNWAENSYLRKKEIRILSQVNKIMVFSELFRNDLIKEYGLDKRKCFTVYNGFHNDSWKNYSQKSFKNINEKFSSKYINITLTGSYSLADHEPTSIETFLKAILTYEHKNKFRITVVGIKRDGHIYWENLLKEIINFTGVVDHEVAINMILQSDILLMAYPHNSIFTSRYMIMGKFMDYIKSKKPIWGIYKYPSEFSTMIDQYGLGIICENNDVEIKKCFDLLFELKEKNNLSSLRTSNFDQEYFYNRDFQNDKFIKNLS
jgi:glycosyltransferase involved in cell wall biosynthesis